MFGCSATYIGTGQSTRAKTAHTQPGQWWCDARAYNRPCPQAGAPQRILFRPLSTRRSVCTPRQTRPMGPTPEARADVNKNRERGYFDERRSSGKALEDSSEIAGLPSVLNIVADHADQTHAD